MKVLYYDCFSGISGDMNLSAMVDLGVDFNYLKNELKKVNLDGYEITMKKDSRKCISGTKIDVKVNKDIHEHRHINDIEKIITQSQLSSSVKEISMKIFGKIAEAEAKVHGINKEEVHFHEVGAVDSIIDVIGAAICFDYIKPDRILASPVELGGGFVKCMHGIYPVPAPAVAEILKGVPVKLGAVQVETTTPTGAAILSANVNNFTAKRDFTINKIGCGIGERDNEIPNVLRVYLAETTNETNESYLKERAYILECNIDDMNPERYDYIINLLFRAGAQDVFITQVLMKKSRPGVKLSVLCLADNVSKAEDIIFKESTTLGIRKYEVEKDMLCRREKKINTKFGGVTVKEAFLNSKMIKFKPEYDECVKLAESNNVPLDIIYSEIQKLYTTKGDIDE